MAGPVLEQVAIFKKTRLSYTDTGSYYVLYTTNDTLSSTIVVCHSPLKEVFQTRGQEMVTPQLYCLGMFQKFSIIP